MGPFTRLKNGCPIVSAAPSAASLNTGNIVPHRVTNATVRNRMFCPRKALSRDTSASKRALLLRDS